MRMLAALPLWRKGGQFGEGRMMHGLLTGDSRGHVENHHAADEKARRKILLVLGVDALSAFHEPGVVSPMLARPPLLARGD